MRPAALLVLLALPVPAFAEGPHWSYEGEAGPSAWAALDEAWGTCATGTAQSPVDLGAAREGEVEDLALAWTPGLDWMVSNNGHTIQVAPHGGSAGTLVIGGVPYEFVQFHFHHPSEHAIGGARTEAEVHFVHRSAEGALAVIGVMLRGGGEAGPFDAIMAAAPAQVGEADLGALDPGAMLPDVGHFFRYMGSLTTPPCSEGVTWTVLSRSTAVSDAALASFAALFPHDARPLQVLGEREILTN